MNLVDFTSMKKGKLSEQGFYAAANCPACTMPIYWHGPGTLNGEEKDGMLYPSCLCMYDGEIELAIPSSYEFEIERHSLNLLFRNMYTLYKEVEMLGDVLKEIRSDSGRDRDGDGVRTEDSGSLDQGHQ
jgi:hypothetical protein